MDNEDPVRDAEIYYMRQDVQAEAFEQRAQENFSCTENFESFIHDTDFSDPNWRTVHKSLTSQLISDKIEAIESIKEMYEDYIDYITREQD